MMIFKRSSDTENCSNGAENSALNHRIPFKTAFNKKLMLTNEIMVVLKLHI